MNLRPLDPQSSALTKLRHSPCLGDGRHPSGASMFRPVEKSGRHHFPTEPPELNRSGVLKVVAEPHDQLYEAIQQINHRGDDEQLEMPGGLQRLDYRCPADRALPVTADLVILLKLRAGLTPRHENHLAEKS